jgi:hypothetical protein
MTYPNYLTNCQVHLLDFAIYTNSRVQKITLEIQNFATASKPYFLDFHGMHHQKILIIHLSSTSFHIASGLEPYDTNTTRILQQIKHFFHIEEAARAVETARPNHMAWPRRPQWV